MLLTFLGVISAKAAWSESNRVGSDVYVFRSEPARMDRYDLVNEEWKETVLLPEKAESFNAAHVDEGGIYLGYGSAVYRYDLEGQNETFVLNQTSSIFRIFSSDNMVISVAKEPGVEGQITTFRKSNNSLAATQSIGSFQIDTEFATFEPVTGTLYFRRSSSFSYVTIESGGTISTFRGIQLVDNGSFGSNQTTNLFFDPSGERFIGTEGKVFSETNEGRFERLLVTEIKPRDLVFLGEDVPVGIEGNQIVALRNNLQIAGRQQVDFMPERLFLFGDQVFVFGNGDDGEPTVAKVALTDLGDPQPGEPIDQVGTSYDPNYVFVDQAGILNIYSVQFSTLFRWDSASQQPVPSINLKGTPFSYTYSPTRNRFYLGFAGGKVDYVDLSDSSGQQRTLVSGLDNIQVVADAGSNVLVQKSFGDTTLYRSNGTVLANGGTFIETNGGPAKTVWDGVSNRFYGSRFGQPSMIPLSGGTFGSVVTGNGFSNNAVPLVITPNRSGLIMSSGEIANLSNLSKNALSLGNPVLDATRLGSGIKTIREISGLSQIQSWNGNSLAPGEVKQLPGLPVAIDRVGVDQLVVVTLGENGVPSYYMLGNDLAVVAPANLEAPVGLQVGVTGTTTAEVTWFDVSGEDSYSIERRPAGTGEFEEVGTVSTSVTTFFDSGLDGPGASYEYRVVAVNGDLRSEASGVAEVRFELPGMVTGVELSDVGENSAVLNWNPLGGISGYEVEWFWIRGNQRAEGNPQPGPGETSYLFNNLRNNEEYRFRVRGVNGLGVGPWSVVTGQTLPPLPSVPGNFRLQNTPKSYEISMYWSASNVNGGQFLVERKGPGDADFQEVAVVDQFGFTDRSLDPLTTYLYRVRYQNSRGISDYSEVFEVSTAALDTPEVASFFNAINVEGGVELKWSFLDPTVTDVVIQRRTDESQEYADLMEVSADGGEVLDDTAIPGFRYFYRILGKNQVGVSDNPRDAVVLAIDGVCLLDLDFEGTLEDIPVEVRGAVVDRNVGAGFTDGGVLFFNGGFDRTLITPPLNLRYGGSISLTGRVGDSTENPSSDWDEPEPGELPYIEYLNLDENNNGFGGNWRFVQRAFTNDSGVNEMSRNWNSYTISLPPIDSERGVIVRIRQNEPDGPGIDVWAIDDLCILGHREPNHPPVLNPEIPATLTANATGDPMRVNFSRWVTEEDELDRVYYEIGAVSNPAIFSGFTIDLESGLLNLEFAEQATGSSTVEVVANDSEGGSVSHTFTVNAPPLHAPTIVREGLVELNPTTGKYEQTLTIANNGPRGIAGIQVVVTSLNNGFVLDGHEDNIAVSNSPLGPGETVSLVLEYHSKISGVAPRPDFEVQILNPEGEPQAPGGGEPALRVLSDSSKLFSFDAVVGKTYQIEYSYDMITWKVSPVTVTAGANRAQWLDQGEPKTDCHPSECTSRYYRVVEVVED